MEQVLVTLDVGDFNTDEDGAYQLHFQSQYATEIAEVDSKPKFSKSHFEILTPAEMDGTIFLHIIAHRHENETVAQQKVSIQLNPSLNTISKVVSMAGKITGTLTIKYKTSPAIVSQIVRSSDDADYLLHVTVGYLNCLLETPFNLLLSVSSPKSMDQPLTSFHLSNTQYYAVSKVTHNFGQERIQVKIKETGEEETHSFSTSLTPTGADSIIYITLSAGDILTVILKYSQVDHSQMYGMIHSSVMREGSIISGEDRSTRLSLTPRRKSTMISPRDSMTRTSKIPGTSKQVLFLEDESDSSRVAASTEDILKKAGLKTTSAVEALDTAYAEGAFVFSTSRSEILEVEDSTHRRKTKHLKRREMQNIALGILKVKKNFLSNPLKLKASLLNVTFPADENTPDQRQPSPELKFSGEVSEVSREIFAESGLITCALEGKLHIPDSRLVGDQLIEVGGSFSEKIMVFKVIVSIITYDHEDFSRAHIAHAPRTDSLFDDGHHDSHSDVSEIKHEIIPAKEVELPALTEETEETELQNETELNLPLMKQKLTPVPSEKGEGSKKSSQQNSRAALEEVPGDATETEKLKSNKSSHKSLLSNKSKDPLKEEEKEELKEEEEKQPLVETGRESSRKSLHSDSSKKSVKSNQPPTADEKDDELELPTTENSLKLISEEDLLRAVRSKGELQGISEAFKFGDNLTVEDIINRRFPHRPNTQEFEQNKKNISVFAEILKEELLEKQKLIDELIKENKQKYQVMGNLCFSEYWTNEVVVFFKMEIKIYGVI
jgi:hypothetical protein